MGESQGKVFVIDDDASVRRGLERLLRSAAYEVETFASAAAFLERERSVDPACIILDIYMPGKSGTELQAELSAAGYNLPIIFLTGHGEIPLAVRALKDGAVDFLTKPVDDTVLLASVHQAIARHRAVLDAQSDAVDIRRRLRTLTPREFEVMRCVLSGARNKQIAAHMGIAEKTVKIHRGRVMEKMDAASVADLIRQCSLVDVEPDKL
ncbi:MAG: response regulator [Gammaproteobacteria bacterium]|nr:response regulator [Gammaproteobacteria bacterium]MDJ0892309.1 response regulator [Gammaproteobacteria bacterium]